jgi:Domain of unknown function (DUF1707)
MAGPGDEIAAGAEGRGHLRASHADREQVIETLKAAFMQGRLTKDELDLRLGQALASRTYAELAAVTADIPAGLTTGPPPTPARAQGEQPVLRAGPVITAATVLYAGVWVYAMFFPKGGDGPSKFSLIFDSGFVYLIILATCVGLVAALRREQRSGGQSPRRPAAGAGGQAPQRLPSADPGRLLPPAGPSHRDTAEAARRRRLPRPALPGSRPLRRWHLRTLLTATAGTARR